jgi:hypothetical protein
LGLGCVWSLLLILLVVLGFFLIVATLATSGVWLAIFVASALGRVVLLRLLILLRLGRLHFN